jgi:hypothetical protein
MAFNYLQDQSWLDIFLLTLPILIPFFISLYFIIIDQHHPEIHTNTLPINSDIERRRRRMGYPSDETRYSDYDYEAAEAMLYAKLAFQDLSVPLTASQMHSEDVRPSVRRRRDVSSTGPLPFVDRVFVPELVRDLTSGRYGVNEDDIVHRENARQLWASELAPVQESHQDPWSPDGFRLPEADTDADAEHEENPAHDDHTFEIVDRTRRPPRQATPDTNNTSHQPTKPNLRGGAGSELGKQRKPLHRHTSEELREYIRRNRAETLATLLYYGRAQVRARERSGRVRRYAHCEDQRVDCEEAVRRK